MVPYIFLAFAVVPAHALGTLSKFCIADPPLALIAGETTVLAVYVGNT
jgi:hypothetical protein